MAFRIETVVEKETVTIMLSGRLDVESVSEVQRILSSYPEASRFVLDLKGTRLVERYAIGSLRAFELEGVELVNSPPYVHDWMTSENGS